MRMLTPIRFLVKVRSSLKKYRLTVINWILLIGFSALLSVVVFFFLQKSDRDVRSRAELTVKASLSLTQETLKNIWLQQHINISEMWATDPELLAMTKQLIPVSGDKEGLRNAAIQKTMREYVLLRIRQQDILDLTVISPEFINLFSSVNQRIGDTSLVALSYKNKLREVFRGKDTFIPPLRAKVLLPDPLGNEVMDFPCLFVCSPIRDASGKVVAALAIRYDPRRDFALVTRTGFSGKSGETYLVDSTGRLVSESRFATELNNIGLIDQEESILKIDVRDPSALLGKKPIDQSALKSMPLTLAASEIIQKKSGYNVAGYKDYRGVRVIGAWVWDDNLGLGFISEMNEADVLLPYHDTFTIAVGLASVTTILAFIFLIAWRKITIDSIDSTIKNEKLLKIATESAGIYVAEIRINPDNSITTVKENGVNIFGSEVLKTHATEDWHQRMHPDDRDSMISTMTDVFTGKTDSYQLEYRYLHPKDDTYTWLSSFGKSGTSPSDLSKSVFVVTQNINKRKLMEESVKQEWEKLQSLLHSSPVGIAITVNGVIRFCNPKYTAMFGFNAADTIGNIYQNPEDRALVITALENNGIVKDAELKMLDGNKEPIDVLVTAYKTNYAGENAVVSWATDITRQKQSAKELSLLNEIVFEGLEAANVGAWWMDFMEEDTYYALDNTAHLIGVPVSRKGQRYSIQDWMKMLRKSAEIPKFKKIIEEVIERFEGAITGKYPDFRMIYPIIKMNGDTCWVNVRATVPKQDERGMAKFMVGVLIDVTEQKLAEESMLKSQEEFRFSLEAIEAYYWTLDLRTGGMAYDSGEFYKQYGYSEDEIPTTVAGHQNLNHPDDLAESIVIWQEYISGATKNYKSEQRLKRKDGSWAWTLNKARAVEYDENGKTTKIAGISIDISQQKEAEHELFLAKEAAVSATQSKSEFLARMSHEIRTPMNAIIGITYLTLQTELSQKQRDNLKKVHSSGVSLLEIINDILDFSKIEAGRLELEHIEFDLEIVFNEMANVVTYKAHEKSLEVVFDLQQSLPPMLVGDPLRLKQVLINLVNNAIKFTDTGEVVVRAQETELTEDRLKILFTVKDTGIGLTQEEISRLFQSFSQADSSTTRKYGGTGLGLSICKTLVEMLGGEIWVESEKGIGSTFSFTGWFDRSKHQKPRELKPPLDLRGMRVLVCDDNETAAEVIREVLEGFTFHVTIVRSGKAAIEELEKNRTEPYQLVFMDWNMPEMDGVKAIQLIQANTLIEPKPVSIMLTAHNRQDVLMTAEEAGVSACLIKPVSYSHLFDTIMIAFDKEGNRPASQPHHVIAPEVLASLQGALVLLVEDNVVNQDVAIGMLEECGVTAEVANNGMEAVAKVRASGIPSRYQLIIMDLRMPVMDGYEATREIRKMAAYNNVPIIAMTADAIGDIREKCMEAGMNDLISKPIEPSIFYGTLANWISVNAASEKQDKTLPVRNHVADDIHFPTIPGVDQQARIARFRSNASYLQFLRNFYKHFSDFIPELRSRLKEQDSILSQRMVHDLKGLSGMLDFPELQSFAHALDEKLRKKSHFDSEVELKSLTNLLEPALAVIKSIVQQYPGTEQTENLKEGNLDGAVAVKALTQLKELLEQSDFASLKQASSLFSIEGIGRYKNEITEISGYISEFEFDKALVVVQTLIQQIRKF